MTGNRKKNKQQIIKTNICNKHIYFGIYLYRQDRKSRLQTYYSKYLVKAIMGNSADNQISLI